MTYDFPIAGTYTVNGSYYDGGQRYESKPVTVIATGLALSANKTVVPLDEAVTLSPKTVAYSNSSYTISEATNVSYDITPTTGYTRDGNTITFTADGIYRIIASSGSDTSNQLKIVAGTPSATVTLESDDNQNSQEFDITDLLGAHSFDDITGFKVHFNENKASCALCFGDNGGSANISISNGNDYIVLRGDKTFNTTKTIKVTNYDPTNNHPFPVTVTVLFDTNLKKGAESSGSGSETETPAETSTLTLTPGSSTVDVESKVILGAIAKYP